MRPPAQYLLSGKRDTRSKGALLAIALMTLTIAACQPASPAAEARLIVPPTLATNGDGFARATGPGPLLFPTDHGPHPDYQTEWWYLTGSLSDEDSRRFGYQLTFFRRALVPPAARQDRNSAWATDQVYMAHFTVTDVEGERFEAHERFARGAAGLAGAQAEPFAVWLENWQVRQLEPDVYQLKAAQNDLALSLTLTDAQGPVLHGDQGYSQKGSQPGNASFYYSLARLETAGTLQAGGEEHIVTGTSWMDHEYSTSALSANQIGWDWFSLQLDDGSELMLFQIRRADGSIDPFSSGTWVAPDGRTQALGRGDFRVDVTATWSSPRTGAEYPAGWLLVVPSAGLSLRIQPLLADQELDVSYAYWEGAVEVGGTVTGRGYVELTGYAGSMQGQF